jgi:hypothetical protein
LTSSKPRPAMTSPIFPSSGKGRRSPVPKVTPVQVGRRRKHAKGQPVIKVKFSPSRLSSLSQSNLLHRNNSAHPHLAATRADADPVCDTPTREYRRLQRHLSPSCRH